MIVRSVDVGRTRDCILCTCVSEEGNDGEGVVSEVSALLSYTLRYVSLADLDRFCQFGLREPIHLCTYVSEDTLREVSLADLGRGCQFGLREPMHCVHA